MEKKVLFVATTAKGHLNVFHIPYIQLFKEKGWQVDSVTNGDEKVPYVDNDYVVPIKRSPFKMGNLKAIWQLCAIMKKRKYTLVICHTPMGGVVARLAARICGVAPVIYMAHGFHFYKGAPLVNILLYKNMERFLARWTDGLIVINQEDYEAAQKFRLRKNGKAFLLNGIGAGIKSIKETRIDKKEKQKELGLKEDAFVLLCVGELNQNKNHISAIKALAECRVETAALMICGRGELEEELHQAVKELNIADKVIFYGYRKDINEILQVADVFVFPSFREGLSVSLMEAMAMGLPVICSDIRGNRDLIDENGGFLLAPMDVSGMSKCIDLLYKDKELRKKMGTYNEKRAEKYDLQKILSDMKMIYEDILQKSL